MQTQFRPNYFVAAWIKKYREARFVSHLSFGGATAARSCRITPTYSGLKAGPELSYRLSIFVNLSKSMRCVSRQRRDSFRLPSSVPNFVERLRTDGVISQNPVFRSDGSVWMVPFIKSNLWYRRRPGEFRTGAQRNSLGRTQYCHVRSYDRIFSAVTTNESRSSGCVSVARSG